MDYIQFILYYLVLINAIGFLLMLIDKKKAQNRRRRISETALLTVAAVGGSIGSLAGMYIFRHKTRKKKFTVTIPAFLILQIYFVFYFIYEYM